MATKNLPIWYNNGKGFKQITYEDTDTVFTYNKLAPYPVGTIYFSYTGTSPATLFGGTWAILSTGRVIRAAQGTGIGGADTHTLTVQQMPSHRHLIAIYRSEHEASGYGLTYNGNGFLNRAMVSTSDASADWNSLATGGGGRLTTTCLPIKTYMLGDVQHNWWWS